MFGEEENDFSFNLSNLRCLQNISIKVWVYILRKRTWNIDQRIVNAETTVENVGLNKML